jgi:hypothetical protein
MAKLLSHTTSFNLLAANIALQIIGDENCARLHETLHQNRNVMNQTVRRRHIWHVKLNDMQLLGGIVVWYALDAQLALPLLNPFGDLSGQLVQLTLKFEIDKQPSYFFPHINTDKPADCLVWMNPPVRFVCDFFCADCEAFG